MLALSSIFCDSFQTVHTVTIPTFARFVITATRVCLSGRSDESNFPCQVAHETFSEIVLSDCLYVVLHLELWINFLFQLRSIAKVNVFSEEYAP